jgi:hypothetical protein
LRQYEQMKMLVKINEDIFMGAEQRYVKQQFTINIHENFVDFTKLPKNLSQDAKNILYRPQKMRQLAEGYKKITMLLRSNAMRKQERKRVQRLGRSVRYRMEGYRMPKEPVEAEQADKLYDYIDRWLQTDDQAKKHATEHIGPRLNIDLSNRS